MCTNNQSGFTSLQSKFGLLVNISLNRYKNVVYDHGHIRLIYELVSMAFVVFQN